MKKIQGLIAAPVTPYKANGDINPSSVANYADFLKAEGVSGVFVNGTTGEGFSLTDDERKVMAQAWCEQKSADFKVLIHTAHTSKKTAIELSKYAEQCGADGIGEMGPLFFKPSSVIDLVKDCAATAASVSLPYYYYHMPSMNGVNFKMYDFLAEAADRIPNLCGIKYTDEDLMDFSRCLNYMDGHFDLLYGRDETLLSSLQLGAKGAVGSTYNICAPLYIKIMKLFAEGKISQVNELQNQSIQMITDLAADGAFFSALRFGLHMSGVETGEPRSPLAILDKTQKQNLEKKLQPLLSQYTHV